MASDFFGHNDMDIVSLLHLIFWTVLNHLPLVTNASEICSTYVKVLKSSQWTRKPYIRREQDTFYCVGLIEISAAH